MQLSSAGTEACTAEIRFVTQGRWSSARTAPGEINGPAGTPILNRKMTVTNQAEQDAGPHLRLDCLAGGDINAAPYIGIYGND